MIRQLKQYFAIRSYIRILPSRLAKRLGSRRAYSLEDVNRVARDEHLNTAFIAFAHAIFCTRFEFDEHYGPLRVASTYDGLRQLVSNRYFGGVKDFDAATVFQASKRYNDDPYHESHIAE